MENREIVTNKKANRINRILYGKNAVERDSLNIVLSKKNRVNINAWVKTDGSNSNIGDLLSLVITEYMCDKNGIDINKPVKGIRHLYAIGSILIGYKDAVVWGSGIPDEKSGGLACKLYGLHHRILHKLDIRAVRGPETKRILNSMGYKWGGGGIW